MNTEQQPQPDWKCTTCERSGQVKDGVGCYGGKCQIVYLDEVGQPKVKPKTESLSELRNQLAALSTVCAKQKEALEVAGKAIGVINVVHGNYCRCPICRGEKGEHEKDCTIGQAIALTPADVADQIAQLQKELDLQRTLTVSEKQAKVERGDMYMEEKECADALEQQLAAKDAEIAVLKAGQEQFERGLYQPALKIAQEYLRLKESGDLDKICRAEAAEAKWADEFAKRGHETATLERQIASLQAELADYKESQQDVQRLVRQLDVIWSGEEGAAKQASLCDIVSQIRDEAPELKAAREATQWQPIETAPKDGGVIGGPRIIAMSREYCEPVILKWSPNRPFPHWIEDDGSVINRAPTHWMPLPPAPKGKQ